MRFVEVLVQWLLTAVSFLNSPRRKSSRHRFSRLSLQPLEDRRLLAGTFTGHLWLDVDYDGVFDANETQNFANVTVSLERSGSATLTSTTDANGIFSFTVAANSGYHLSFTLPTSYVVTPQLTSDDFKKSSLFLNQTETNNFTISDGATIHSNAGLALGSTLSVFCWNDVDGDGVQDTGSPEQDGLSTVSVTLSSTKYPALFATTGANGIALFTNVQPGTYTMNVYRSGYNRTIKDAGGNDALDSDVDSATGTTASFLIVPGSNITSIDAGLMDASISVGSITGKAWLDNGDGIRQVGETTLTGIYTFSLYRSTDTTVGNGDDQFVTSDATDANQQYEFLNVTPGLYYVKANPGINYTVAPMGQGPVSTNSDFSPTTLNTTMLNVVAAGSHQNIDLGLIPGAGTIGNRVWNDTDADGIQDAGELGLAGARVQLFTSTNTQVGSDIITDSTGLYLFSNLTTGTYYVRVTPPTGYIASPKSQGGNVTLDSDIDTVTFKTANIAVSSNQSLDWDAGFYLGATIGDRVFVDANKNGLQDVGEGNLANVEVRLYSSTGVLLKTVTTNSSGIYSISGIPTGQYFLGLTPPSGYMHSPRDVSFDGQDTIDNDFDSISHTTILFNVTRGTTQSTWDAGLYLGATVGDKVWLDTNANGRLDLGELGKSGVAVKLKSAGPDGNAGTADDLIVQQTSTDSNGAYSFIGVDNGTYYVEFVCPTGFAFTLRDQGDDIGDSDPGRATGRTSTFTIVNHVSNLTIDAGLIPSGSAVIHVLDDDDCDGFVEPGNFHPGVQCIVIDPRNGIVGDGDDVLVRSGTTDSGGNFVVNDLVPGQYVFQVNLPSGWHFISPGVDSEIVHLCDGYGFTTVLNVVPNQVLAVDVGLCRVLGSIEGVVWNDANSNKVRDGGLVRGSQPSIILAIDVSGSSSDQFAGTSVGDVNGDGYSNTILDAEVQAGILLVQQLIAAGYGSSAYVGVVAFGTTSANIDVNPLATNLQVAGPANNDADSDGVLDIIKALKSLRSGGATNYEAALQQVISSFTSLGTTSGNGNLIFLSDGVPTTGGSFDDEVLTLVAAGVNMRAFGVGQAASLAQLVKIDPFAKIYETGADLLDAINLNNATGYSGERGMANVSVYLDLNNNGLWDSATEPRTATLDDDPDTVNIDEAGYYRFTDLIAGTYTVREIIPTNYSQTYPGASLYKHTIALDAGARKSNVDFGNVANTTYIVDNTDSGYIESGAWSASALLGFNSSSTRFGGTAGSIATWNAPSLAPGYYSVGFWKVAVANNSKNAKVTIIHDGITEAPQTIDLSIGTSGFVDLGIFYFNGSPGELVRINQGTPVGNLRTDAVRFTRSIVNNAPSVNGPSSQSLPGNTPLVFSTSRSNPLSVIDVDAGAASVQLLLSATNGLLTLPSTAGLTFISGANGQATFIVQGTVTNLNTALNGLTFMPNLNFSGATTVSLTINDLGNTGIGGVKTFTKSIVISVSNPVIVVDNSDPGYVETGSWSASSLQGYNNSSTRFGNLAGSTASWSAPTLVPGYYSVSLWKVANSANSKSAKVTIIHNGVTEPSSIIDLSIGTSGFVDLGTYFFSGAPGELVRLSQGTTVGNLRSDVVRFSRLPINNAVPTLTAPTTQSARGNTPLFFSPEYSNSIVVGDVDAGGAEVLLLLSANNGSLKLSSINGLTFTIGVNGQSSFTVKGTLANLNIALSGLSFVPTPNFSGPASISLTINDLGNTGLGGAKSATKSIAITVNSPVFIVDNTDAGYAEAGTWSASALLGYNNTSTRFGNSVNSTATWNAPTLAAGYYSVAIWKVANTSNSKNAKVTVIHNGITDSPLTIDLSTGTSGFVDLGVFYFSGAPGELVRLSQGTVVGNLRADAMRFTKMP